MFSFGVLCRYIERIYRVAAVQIHTEQRVKLMMVCWVQARLTVQSCLCALDTLPESAVLANSFFLGMVFIDAVLAMPGSCA